MLTPNHLLAGFRASALVGAACGTVLLLGPFHYDDLGLPFSDKVAHAILFYTATTAAFFALPRFRRFDLVLTVAALAAASELAQGLVGREMSATDLLGDCLGIVAAALPLYAAAFRQLTNQHPNMPLTDLRRQDRRGSARRRGGPKVSGLGDLLGQTAGSAGAIERVNAPR